MPIVGGRDIHRKQITFDYLLLAVIQGERRWGGCVVAVECGFRGGSGCGRVACDDTVSTSDKGRPSPLPFREVRGGP
jgi:hypothetical protein